MIPTSRRHSEQGFTLVELMVGIVLIGILGTMVSTLIIRTVQTSGVTQARLVSESAAQTGLERLTRDARVANPLSPKTSTTELWVNVQRGARCEERRWYVDTGRLMQQSQSLGNLLCSAARGLTASGPITTSVVVDGLTPDALATIFTYQRQIGADKTMTSIAPDATTAPLVDRIIISLRVKAFADRPPVILTSTVDLRNVVL